MNVREKYEDDWKDYQSAGPANFRAEYHGTPDAEMVALCDESDSRGLAVELTVSDTLHGPQGDGRRTLSKLNIGLPHRTPAVALNCGVPFKDTARRALSLIDPRA